MSITTNSLKSLKFTNSELENILENFGDGSYPTYMQNVKEFSRLLNEFKYRVSKGVFSTNLNTANRNKQVTYI